MELLMDCSVIRIHLKTAKKNDRMDVCSGYLKMVGNSTIIFDKLFETIYYFPESFSNHEVQSYMQKNSHRTFPSLHKCIVSLKQQNQNVVFVNTKCAYAMEETDCLVKILMDLSNKYKNIIDLEYDAVKNCLQDKNTLENGQGVVRVEHTDNFESMVDSGNTICQNQEKNNTMQKRRKVLGPRSEIKDELDENKYFPYFPRLTGSHIFKVLEKWPANLMAIRISSTDPYSLCEVNASFGEIVYEGEGPASAVPQPQPSHQTNTRNVALPNTTVRNDNPTQGRRLEASSSSDSVPSSIPSAHEQHGNQQNVIPKGGAPGGTSVPAFTAEDRIRCPRYQAYRARISTFTKWPSDLTQKPDHVAQAGFYYTGFQDTVRCFACDGGLKNWDPRDDPWIEHARWFPLCPFVQKVKGQEFVELVRRMTEEPDERNNPMAHPPDLQQLNLRNDTGLARHQVIPQQRNGNDLARDLGRVLPPDYANLTVRQGTFTRWLSDIAQTSAKVAEAGFFYTGFKDIVRCFACDGRWNLEGWDPDGDPWVKHAGWFPKCAYVCREKSEEFIKLARMTTKPLEEEDAVHSTFQRNNPMAHPPDLQQLNLRNDTDEPSQLDTDVAQSVLQTGYSKNTVVIAVEELISKDKRTILRENENLKSIVTCMKCKVNSRNTLFLPCTHHCLCEDCAEKCSLCPVCYKIINKKIKTFMIPDPAL